MSAQPQSDRRHQILLATLDLIAESGISGLTHRLIAERAHVPLGSTTYYFDSLSDLIQEASALAAQETQALLTSLSDRLAHSANVQQTIEDISVEFLEQNQHLQVWNEIYFAASRRPELRTAAASWRDGLVTLLANYTARESASILVAFLDGALLHRMVDNAALPPLTIRMAVRTILGDDVLKAGTIEPE